MVMRAPRKLVKRQIWGNASRKFSLVTLSGTTAALIPRRLNQGL
jgi:hypothetical protein